MIRKSQSCDIQLMPRMLQLEPRREASKVQNTLTEFQSKIKETTSLKSIISSQAFCKTEEEFKSKMEHIVIEEEILKCNKIFVGCVLSGPLTIRQISEKNWHLCIELDTSDIKLRNQMPDTNTLKKLFRWPGRDEKDWHLCIELVLAVFLVVH